MMMAPLLVFLAWFRAPLPAPFTRGASFTAPLLLVKSFDLVRKLAVAAVVFDPAGGYCTVVEPFFAPIRLPAPMLL